MILKKKRTKKILRKNLRDDLCIYITKLIQKIQVGAELTNKFEMSIIFFKQRNN